MFSFRRRPSPVIMKAYAAYGPFCVHDHDHDHGEMCGGCRFGRMPFVWRVEKQTPTRRREEDQMKRYLLGIYLPDGDPPPPEVLEPIMRDLDALNQEIKAAGAWVFAGGLHAPSTATVLRHQGDEVLVTDGPFVEGKEHLGGFTIIEVSDLDAALQWGRRLARVLSPLSIEVRPFQDE
jgi:hypothetical protein